jgi:hypothetical protein
MLGAADRLADGGSVLDMPARAPHELRPGSYGGGVRFDAWTEGAERHTCVVGPRPEQPAIFAELREKDNPSRQRVLPGITGWAQVNQCYDRCIDDVRRKVVLDLEYMRRASVAEDMKILARTIPVVLLRKGAW